MTLHDLTQAIAGQAAAITWMEWGAVGFGIAQVLLAWKNRLANYPAGALSALLSIVLLAGASLYAEAALNGYYLVMSLWGWVAWSRPGRAAQAPSFTPARDGAISAGISVLGTAVLWAVLRRYTPSDVPVWDALVSALAWAGTWLLTRRRVENWLLLNASNAIAAPLQWHKGLSLYALFTAVLFAVACIGYRDWRRAATAALKTHPA